MDDVAEVLAGVDARQHDIRTAVTEDMRRADDDAVGWATADHGKALRPTLLEMHLAGEGEAVPCPALVAVRRHHPDVIGELCGDLAHHGEAGRVDAVVIGDEDAKAHLSS